MSAADAPVARPSPRLATLWWIRIPIVFRRVSASLFAYLVDGVWVLAFGWLAALATPLAMAAGLAVGTTTLGYTEAPFESILLVAAIVLIGTLSAHLGLAFVVAFVVGDFFLAGRAWALERSGLLLFTDPEGPFSQGVLAGVARERVPLLIGYALLAAVAVGIPPLIKGLLAQLPVRDSWPVPVQAGISVIGHAGLTYFLLSLWVEATPVLIRPMWIWGADELASRDMALALVQPLQTEGWVVIGAGLIASILRMGLQWRLALNRELGAPISVLQERLRRGRGHPTPPGRIRTLGRVVWRTVFGTVLLAGMIATVAEAVVLTATLFVASLVQLRVVPVPMGRWPELAARIPVLFRMVAALVVVRVLIQPLTERLVDPTAETFRTFLAVSVVVMLVFMLLLPAPKARSGRPGEGA